MNASGDERLDEGRDEDIWDAIAAFEKILEALPTDRTSLETLAGAYEQIGDHARAREYLLRLGEVLLTSGDSAAAAALVPRLKPYAEGDEVVGNLIERVGAAGPSAKGGGSGDGTSASGEAAGEPDAKEGSAATFSIAEEMSMAWNLMKADELSQEDYALVVQDLTEMSGEQGEQTVSTLHVLEGHQNIKLDKIVEFLSSTCNTPFVSMESFELNQEAMKLLPLDFMMRRGTMVFELLGADALVALLNPYDEELRKEVERRVGRDCHFYLVLASDFDLRIERAKDAAEEAL